jgi:hypothetical protein
LPNNRIFLDYLWINGSDAFGGRCHSQWCVW